MAVARTNATSTAPPPPVLGGSLDLVDGEIVEARVLADLGKGEVLLAVRGRAVVAHSDQPLPLQARLMLEVADHGATVRLKRVDGQDLALVSAPANRQAALGLAGPAALHLLAAFERAGAPLDPERLAAALASLDGLPPEDVPKHALAQALLAAARLPATPALLSLALVAASERLPDLARSLAALADPKALLDPAAPADELPAPAPRLPSPTTTQVAATATPPTPATSAAPTIATPIAAGTTRLAEVVVVPTAPGPTAVSSTSPPPATALISPATPTSTDVPRPLSTQPVVVPSPAPPSADAAASRASAPPTGHDHLGPATTPDPRSSRPVATLAPFAAALPAPTSGAAPIPAAAVVVAASPGVSSPRVPGSDQPAPAALPRSGSVVAANPHVITAYIATAYTATYTAPPAMPKPAGTAATPPAGQAQLTAPAGTPTTRAGTPPASTPLGAPSPSAPLPALARVPLAQGHLASPTVVTPAPPIPTSRDAAPTAPALAKALMSSAPAAGSSTPAPPPAMVQLPPAATRPASATSVAPPARPPGSAVSAPPAAQSITVPATVANRTTASPPATLATLAATLPDATTDGALAVHRALLMVGVRPAGLALGSMPTMADSDGPRPLALAPLSPVDEELASLHRSLPAAIARSADPERTVTPDAGQPLALRLEPPAAAVEAARETLAGQIFKPKELADYDQVVPLPLTSQGLPTPARLAVTSRAAANGQSATWVRVDTELSRLGPVSVRLSGMTGGPIAITLVATSQGTASLAAMLPDLMTALHTLGLQAAVRVAEANDTRLAQTP